MDLHGSIFVADNASAIRRITPGGYVMTVAGAVATGSIVNGTAARFDTPYGIAVDSLQNIYVADVNYAIGKLSAE